MFMTFQFYLQLCLLKEQELNFNDYRQRTFESKWQVVFVFAGLCAVVSLKTHSIKWFSLTFKSVFKF